MVYWGPTNSRWLYYNWHWTSNLIAWEREFLVTYIFRHWSTRNPATRICKVVTGNETIPCQVLMPHIQDRLPQDGKSPSFPLCAHMNSYWIDGGLLSTRKAGFVNIFWYKKTQEPQQIKAGAEIGACSKSYEPTIRSEFNRVTSGEVGSMSILNQVRNPILQLLFPFLHKICLYWIGGDNAQ